MKKFFSCSTAPLGAERWGKDDQKLLKAVDGGDVDKISAVLSRRTVRPTKLDEQGRSSFHLAAVKGLVECLDLMLDKGVDTQARDTEGCSALHLASRYGQPDSVRTLLQHGAPVGLRDNQGRTALHHAATSGCQSSITLLCEHGAPANVTDEEGMTALAAAAALGHWRVCEELAGRGAEVNAADMRGRTALMLAAGAGCVDTVGMLVRLGADLAALDQLGQDATHYARQGGNQEVSNVLGLLCQAHNGSEKDAVKMTSAVQGIPSLAVEPLPREAVAMVVGAPEQQWRPGGEQLEEGGREAVQLRQELSLRDRQCETLAGEAEALRSRLRRNSEILRALLGRQGGGREEAVVVEEAARREEEEEKVMLGRVARLLRGRSASEGGQWRVVGADEEEEEKRKDGDLKRRRKQEGVQSVGVEHMREQLEAARRLAEALEGKASAERRVSEIEGHLDNMRAVLAQYEMRKRRQSSAMADMEGQLSECTQGNESLRLRLQEVEQRLEVVRQQTKGSVPGVELWRGREALGGTIAELKQLLGEVRQGYSQAVLERQARQQLSKNLQRELDCLKGRLQSDFVPLEDHERCRASWQESVRELERLVLQLTAQNQNLRGQPCPLDRPGERQGPRQGSRQRPPISSRGSRPVSVGDFTGEGGAVVGSSGSAQMRPWKSEKVLSGGQGEQGGPGAERQSAGGRWESEPDVMDSLLEFLQGATVHPKFSPQSGPPVPILSASPGPGLSWRRMGRIFQTMSPRVSPPAPGTVQQGKEAPACVSVSGVVLQERKLARREKKEEDEGRGDGDKTERMKRELRRLEDDLSREKEVSRNLQAQLEIQEAEIRTLGDYFPPDILWEEAEEAGVGGGGPDEVDRGRKGAFECPAMKELLQKVASLSLRYQQAQTTLRTQLEELPEARQRIRALEERLGELGQETVSREEHQRTVLGLESKVAVLRIEVERMEEDLGQRRAEVERLQAEVDRACGEVHNLEAREDRRLDEARAEADREAKALRGEVGRLFAQCQAAQHEVEDERRGGAKLSQQVTDLEARLANRESEAWGLRESLRQLQERADRLEDSGRDKDHMIVRLQDEVETLSNQSTFLQQETLKLREQIKVVRKHHHDVISVYRTHLLRAAQGTMDDEVHSMLLHIYSMQRQAVC